MLYFYNIACRLTLHVMNLHLLLSWAARLRLQMWNLSFVWYARSTSVLVSPFLVYSTICPWLVPANRNTSSFLNVLSSTFASVSTFQRLLGSVAIFYYWWPTCRLHTAMLTRQIPFIVISLQFRLVCDSILHFPFYVINTPSYIHLLTCSTSCPSNYVFTWVFSFSSLSPLLLPFWYSAPYQGLIYLSLFWGFGALLSVNILI